MATILIRDKVKCTVKGHTFEKVTGKVLASKDTGKGIEHQVEFPKRKYTLEEMERGDDVKYQDENVVWLLGSEIEKIED
ncbi:hypothetical protein AB3480_00405 [Rhizobium mongolense]|uniref:hypothetical protein n=1 Tax=Rhizobium mongolense TaxID=57676 RepID=UPI0034A30B3E